MGFPSGLFAPFPRGVSTAARTYHWPDGSAARVRVRPLMCTMFAIDRLTTQGSFDAVAMVAVRVACLIPSLCCVARTCSSPCAS